MDIPTAKKHVRHSSGILGFFVVVIIVSIGIIFYVRGQAVMEEETKAHLQSLALTATLIVEPEDLHALRVPSDALKPVYEKVIQELNIFRSLHPEIHFIYILRPTKTLNTFTFVADADSLHPFPPYSDLNKDGVIDGSDELAPPGKEYDVSSQPIIYEALKKAIVSDMPYSDQWGTYMTGYAPIPGHGLTEDTVIGVDMDLTQYKDISKSLVTPGLLVLIFAMGIVLGLVIVIELTHKKIESERALEADRSMLLNLTTHQLGTPIATLRWWLEILRDRDRATFGEKDSVIDELEIGMRRIENIMKQLTQANSVQQQDFSYQATSVVVESLIHEVVEDVQKSFDLRRQTLTIAMMKNLPTIRIDKRLIAGVIRELLENASSYSKVGDMVELRVQAQNEHLTIEVADSGIGIPNTDLPHITEKFRRASNATSIKSIGSGLGLHIAHAIVEKADGTMQIASTEGKGTKVTIKLPIR